MIYQYAIDRETYQAKNAEKIHPEFTTTQLREFIKEKCHTIELFRSKKEEIEKNAIQYH